MKRAPLLVVLAAAVAAVAAGCGGASVKQEAPGEAAAAVDGQTCPGPDAGPRRAWRHRWTRATATLFGGPQHAADDPVINPGSDALVEGKFAYGRVSKDLEGEDVTLWLQLRCGAWAAVDRQRTDRDGRARFRVGAARIPRPGAYRFVASVDGDRSEALGYIYVVAPGTRAVLFDVDGTLTTGDGQLIADFLGGDAEVRPGAVEVARRHAAAGEMPIYMTGRPYNLREITRDWLGRHGFPRGPLLTTRRIRDSLPGGGRVGRFKRDSITALTEGAGVDIRYAYGNASTDVCSYANAGLAPERTFIIGDHGGDACDGYPPTQAVHDYPEHLAALDTLLRP